MITCWSVKGGVGTTTVVAGLGVVAAEHPLGCLLVDLDGDLPAALGLSEPAGPGLAGWVAAADAPPDAIGRLEERVGPGLRLLPRGGGPVRGPRLELLAALLATDARTVLVDAGRLDRSPERLALVEASRGSILVTRACYLSLHRLRFAPARPSGVIVVRDPARALKQPDIESVTGAPLLAEVRTDPAVARTIDAGLLVARPPRSFAAALAGALALDAGLQAA